MTVTLKNGRTFTGQRDFPKGDPQEPLTPVEINTKFLENAAARYSANEATELARLVRALPELGDTKPLWQMLGRA